MDQQTLRVGPNLDNGHAKFFFHKKGSDISQSYKIAKRNNSS